MSLLKDAGVNLGRLNKSAVFPTRQLLENNNGICVGYIGLDGFVYRTDGMRTGFTSESVDKYLAQFNRKN